MPLRWDMRDKTPQQQAIVAAKDRSSLQEFDDELFKTLVEKVLVKDAKHVVFVFEDGLEFETVLEKVKK